MKHLKFQDYSLHSLSRLFNGFLSIFIVYYTFVFAFHLLLIFFFNVFNAVMFTYYLHAMAEVPFLTTVIAAIETIQS